MNSTTISHQKLAAATVRATIRCWKRDNAKGRDIGTLAQYLDLAAKTADSVALNYRNIGLPAHYVEMMEIESDAFRAAAAKAR